MSKKSLASESTALIPADVGGALDAITGGPVAVVDTSSSTTYVTFISTKSKRWGELAVAIPGLQDGDVVLVRPKPQPSVKLTPFRFFLLTGTQYWAESDDDGKILSATLENPGRKSPAQPKEERFDGIVFAFLPDGSLEPARMSLRTTKCGAGKDAVRALDQAATPEWGQLSQAHAQTLQLPKPWMRFVANVTTARRTSRSSGYAYVAANAGAVPTSANDLHALKVMFDRGGFAAEIDALRESYDARVAEVRSKAGV